MSQPLPPEPDDDRPRGGFGAPIRKEKPAPEVKSKPSGDYGVIVGPDGKMKTTRDNLPKSAIEEAMDLWYKAFNVENEEDYE